MKCQEIVERLSEYIDGELGPSWRAEIERHTEDCEPCYIFVSTLTKTVELVREAGRRPPPIPPQAAANLRAVIEKRAR